MESLVANDLKLNSQEVADMIGKRHANLIRDIEMYQEYLSDGQNSELSSDVFFVESSYKSGTGKRYKCYLIIKKGCELIAHKMTGKKGTQFSAMYINRFHEMEQELAGKPSKPAPKLSDTKYYNGERVVTLRDIEAMHKVPVWTLRYYMRYLKEGKHYYHLAHEELAEFKAENGGVEPGVNHLFVINQAGFMRLAQFVYGLPKALEGNKVPKETLKRVEYTDLHESEEVQQLIDLTIKELGALELVIRKFNRYNTHEEYEFYKQVIANYEESLIQKTCAIRLLEV